jgi:hypothetical protein
LERARGYDSWRETVLEESKNPMNVGLYATICRNKSCLKGGKAGTLQVLNSTSYIKATTN